VVATADALWAWGWNKFGQLGQKTAEEIMNAPIKIIELSRDSIKSKLIACGWKHTIVVTTDAHVYSWGRGTNGQLGFKCNSDMYASPPSPARRASMCTTTLDTLRNRARIYSCNAFQDSQGRS
jgi:alpha-tubulin suppressor-like RCC1 family protein